MGTRKWYEQNKEHAQKKARDYYWQNKEKVLKNVQEYREKNRETIKEKGKEYYRRKLKNRLWNAAKARARKFNMDFDITVDDFILPVRCPLLGIEMKVNKGRHSVKKDSFSLDRIDSTKGYVKGNVWVISMLANNIKNNATLSEVEELVKNWKRWETNGYDMTGVEERKSEYYDEE